MAAAAPPAKLYWDPTGLGRQPAHSGGLSGQLQINSPTALTPGVNKTLSFLCAVWEDQTEIADSSRGFPCLLKWTGGCTGRAEEKGEWTGPRSQLLALHVKVEQSILWRWWKESIAKTHLDWTTPLITRKAAEEKQKFTGRKKIQRNSHKEAECHRTGSKPEYYKNTTELSSIKKANQNKLFHFLPFVPAGKNQSARLFAFPSSFH